MRAAAQGVVREHKGLLPNTILRPGDFTIADLYEQQMGVFEFTIVSPFPGVMPTAATQRSRTAQQAERQKDDRYFDACAEQNLCFVS